MSDSLYLQLRHAGLISLLTLPRIFISAQAACYNTPRTAIDALKANPSISMASESSGYRVTRIQSDPVLGQRWAMITSCGHPEWPSIALPTNGASSLNPPQGAERPLTESVRQALVIRAGDVVRLWRQESLLRIEVTGVSEESGGLGNTVRVRLLRSAGDQSIPEQFSGVVRGPSNVEIQP